MAHQGKYYDNNNWLDYLSRVIKFLTEIEVAQAKTVELHQEVLLGFLHLRLVNVNYDQVFYKNVKADKGESEAFDEQNYLAFL